MIVHYVWMPDCPFCQALKDGCVPDRLRRTFVGIPDVRWVPVRIDNIGRATLHKKDGRIHPKQLLGNVLHDLNDMVEEVYTPQVILEAGDVVEEFHPFEEAIDHTGLDKDEQIAEARTTPRAFTRALMKSIYRFYLQHATYLDRENARILRQQETIGAPHRLEPAYEWDEEAGDAVYRIHSEQTREDGHLVEKRGWKDAFIRAKEAEY